MRLSFPLNRFLAGALATAFALLLMIGAACQTTGQRGTGEQPATSIQKATSSQRAPASAALTPFEDDERWGYRDAHGKIVIPPQYVIAQEFSPGGIAMVVDGQGWACIDRRGEVLLRPFVYDNGPDYFSEGLARFVKDGKVGFFDERGQVVIPARYDHARPFAKGRAAVCRGCVAVPDGEHTRITGDSWSYVDRQGNAVDGP